MALIGSDFYVANTDAVLRFPYKTGDTRIDAPGVPVLALPAGRHRLEQPRYLDRSGSHVADCAALRADRLPGSAQSPR